MLASELPYSDSEYTESSMRCEKCILDTRGKYCLYPDLQRTHYALFSGYFDVLRCRFFVPFIPFFVDSLKFFLLHAYCTTVRDFRMEQEREERE